MSFLFVDCDRDDWWDFDEDCCRWNQNDPRCGNWLTNNPELAEDI